MLKYTVITEALVKQNAMSNFERYVQLLQGLPEKIQWKVLKYGCRKGWKMMEHCIMMKEPKFDVKSVVLEKAYMIERREMFVSGRHLGFEAASSGRCEPSGISITSMMVSMVPKAVMSLIPIVLDLIGGLMKQIMKLKLFLEGQLWQQASPVAEAASQWR